jgi:hypothetical protein
MSLNDGKFTEDRTGYITSDIALAAYLITRGYELLGAVDNGSKRKEFGLTHTDPEILKDMSMDVMRKADEYDNLYFQVPHEPNSRVNFRTFYRNIKNCHHALDEAIKGNK